MRENTAVSAQTPWTFPTWSTLRAIDRETAVLGAWATVCALHYLGFVPEWVPKVAAVLVAVWKTIEFSRDSYDRHVASPQQKLKKQFKPFPSEPPSVYGPEELVDDVVLYAEDAPENEFLVLTGVTSTATRGAKDVFAAALKQNEAAFQKKKVVVVPVAAESTLKEALSEVFKFTKVEPLQEVGRLAVSRSWLGGSKSAVFVVDISEEATKEKVASVLSEAAILKPAGAAALDLFVCLRDATKLPTTLPGEARLDKATREARTNARATVTEALTLIKRAPEFGLSDDELNYLAFVKICLKMNDADTIEEAGEILDSYLSASKDDSAVRAALKAFARFGFARK